MSIARRSIVSILLYVFLALALISHSSMLSSSSSSSSIAAASPSSDSGSHQQVVSDNVRKAPIVFKNYIIVFRHGTVKHSIEEVQSMVEKLGGTFKKALKIINAVVATFPTAAYETLSKLPQIDYIEEDQEVKALSDDAFAL